MVLEHPINDNSLVINVINECIFNLLTIQKKETMKRYKILKGWHYAFVLFRRLGGWSYNEQRFLIKFKLSKECWWSPKRNKDDGDLNKLIGLSFGVFGIHKNSLRLVWRPDFDNRGKIQIYGYVYDTKIKGHTTKYITTVSTEQLNYASFNIFPDKYRISVNNITIEMDNPTADKKVQKTLYPYVGGDNTAIRTMYFNQEIKPV